MKFVFETIAAALLSMRGNAEEERRAERKAERKLRKIEIAGIYIAAFIAAVAVVAGVIDAWRTRSAMNEQLKAMNGQLDLMRADQRAWLSLVEIKPRRSPWGNEGIHYVAENFPAVLPLEMVIKNVGSGPAFNVRAGAWPLYGYQQQVKDLKALQREACATLDKYPAAPVMTDSEDYKRVLFPNELFKVQSVALFMPRKDMEKYATGKPKSFQLWFFGCVRYTLSGSDDPHQTGFAYRVDRLISANIPGGKAIDVSGFPIGRNISVDELVFAPRPMAEGDTD